MKERELDLDTWINQAFEYFGLEDQADLDEVIALLLDDEYVQYIEELKEDMKNQMVDTATKNALIGFISWRRTQLKLSNRDIV